MFSFTTQDGICSSVIDMVFKKYVLFLVLLAHLVANRPFGRVIYDLTLKYEVNII